MRDLTPRELSLVFGRREQLVEEMCDYVNDNFHVKFRR
jgi:hypothetical protein